MKVTELSNGLVLIVHAVCNTEESVDTHPQDVTEEEKAEILRRAGELLAPSEAQEPASEPPAPKDTVTETGNEKNKTRVRTSRGIKA